MHKFFHNFAKVFQPKISHFRTHTWLLLIVYFAIESILLNQHKGFCKFTLEESYLYLDGPTKCSRKSLYNEWVIVLVALRLHVTWLYQALDLGARCTWMLGAIHLLCSVRTVTGVAHGQWKPIIYAPVQQPGWYNCCFYLWGQRAGEWRLCDSCRLFYGHKACPRE